MPVQATCLGYPRIGAARELKWALERYWSGAATAMELTATAAELRRRHWSTMKSAGLDQVPTNDFSLYDHMLDMATTVGAVPERYRVVPDPLDRYFAMARGLQDRERSLDLPALEMTKWFDTNYHYIVPEIAVNQTFRLDATRILQELDEAQALGVGPRPVIPGPVSFLLLAKHPPGTPAAVQPLALLDDLLPVYRELLALLAERGVAWVQLDEPCLVTDLSDATAKAYRRALGALAAATPRPRLLVTTYFGPLGTNLELVTSSGCDGLHLDLVRAPEQLEAMIEALPAHMTLSAGVVDGRNVWRVDLDAAHALLHRAVKAFGAERVLVAPSCSLLHVPVDAVSEQGFDEELRSWLAFAEQKLSELRALADAAEQDTPDSAAFVASRAATVSRSASPRITNAEVRQRAANVTAAMLTRTAPFARRRQAQQMRIPLPAFPTTTIGSFPQTRELREARAAWRRGRMSESAYHEFLKEATRRCVAAQEAIGLDVLVHGEFERTDMVEYFGAQLDGFAFTANGWVQSYGSRCVKPPLLSGDVMRRRPMTVEWSRYAQSLTAKPMKGMLTGPVTILQWSFVRNDLPRSEVCRQIALALRDEVVALEAAGIAIIQVDEPAIREGVPLRRAERGPYLRWAVDVFRLATSGVRDDTQIHTHMCYSEFGEILGAIAELDADVLSIETSRSRMELLDDFRRAGYPNDVGPGVYDIHSPRVPAREEIFDLLRRAAAVLPAEQLWVNPDCGLKTRAWPEVEAALTAMVDAARRARTELVPRS